MKKKCLVIADEHGRGTFRELIEKHGDQVDTIVCLGDYVDSFDVHDSTIIENLQQIIQLKKDNPDKVHLLLGNHDIQYVYLGKPQFNCSGFRPKIAGILNMIFNDNKDLFDIALYLDSKLLSHAGVTTSWLRQFNAILEPYSLYCDINNLPEMLNMCLHEHVSQEALNMIGQVGSIRGGYSGYAGGPLWADKSELIKGYEYGIDQICGHTYLRDGVPYTFYTDTGEMLRFIDIADGQLDYPTIIEYDTLTK